MALTIQGVCIPDSQLVRAPTESVRDTVLPLIVDHSSRVYYFRAQTGAHRGWSFHRALLHAGALFHDLGLTPKCSSEQDRFEMEGANAARDFLRRHGIPQADADTVWTAIALHTTPGISRHMHPVIAFNPEYVTEGEM